MQRRIRRGTIGSVGRPEHTKFKGTLDVNGHTHAAINVPTTLPLPNGETFYHAYVVYDSVNNVYMASNPVPLELKCGLASRPC